MVQRKEMVPAENEQVPLHRSTRGARPGDTLLWGLNQVIKEAYRHNKVECVQHRATINTPRAFLGQQSTDI